MLASSSYYQKHAALMFLAHNSSGTSVRDSLGCVPRSRIAESKWATLHICQVFPNGSAKICTDLHFHTAVWDHYHRFTSSPILVVKRPICQSDNCAIESLLLRFAFPRGWVSSHIFVSPSVNCLTIFFAHFSLYCLPFLLLKVLFIYSHLLPFW